jgi:hypothetical protein
MEEYCNFNYHIFEIIIGIWAIQVNLGQFFIKTLVKILIFIQVSKYHVHQFFVKEKCCHHDSEPLARKFQLKSHF